ncbi:MAG TPA: carboxymuconolactone decarboxylase family protein [Candidatus Sulfotelmatobacter sp.]|nr:carboxymuconolactone decarboxylase family protein [Candidatus Sulfotelmatobacter sp.]
MLKARINNPAILFPDAMQHLQALSQVSERSGAPARTLALMHLRASQINGCSVCVDLHVRFPKYKEETIERMLAVGAWRDAPYFTDAERAALALTEAVTRLSDREDPVPDAVWDEAAKHYDEKAIGGLLLTIASVNLWNRLNVATRQVAGEWFKSAEGKAHIEKASAAR